MLDLRKSFFSNDPESEYTVSNTILGFDVSRLPAGTVTHAWLLIHPDQVGDHDNLALAADWFAPEPGACDASSFEPSQVCLSPIPCALSADPNCESACELANLHPNTDTRLRLRNLPDNLEDLIGSAAPAYVTLRLAIDGTSAPSGSNYVVQHRSTTPGPALIVEICETATPTPTPATITVLYEEAPGHPDNPFPSDRLRDGGHVDLTEAYMTAVLPPAPPFSSVGVLIETLVPQFNALDGFGTFTPIRIRLSRAMHAFERSPPGTCWSSTRLCWKTQAQSTALFQAMALAAERTIELQPLTPLRGKTKYAVVVDEMTWRTVTTTPL